MVFEFRLGLASPAAGRCLRALLAAPLGFAGSASFAVVDADSADAYVARHSTGWRRSAHRPTRPWIWPVALGLAALGIGLAVGRRRRPD